MGMVYQARHLSIGRRLAVKFLHAEFARNDQIVKRFHREAQTSVSIEHKNIIDVMDIGITDQGEPYLVMEYLEGEALGNMLTRSGPIDLATACGILEPTLQALAAAHEKGIVHRDLKPDNIFLVHQKGDAPSIKLIDFGISKVTTMGNETKLTMDGTMLGTPAYMSPEQARGSADVDNRTDIYAVGIIMYEMLTGQLPYEGENFNDLLINAMTVPPKDPWEVYGDFPRQAWPLIERAISKAPGDRFQTVEEMLSELRALSTMEERHARLTCLGATIAATSQALGDLGSLPPAPDPDRASAVAAELFSPASIDKGKSAVSNGFLAVRHALTKSFTGPRRKLYQSISGGVAILLVGVLVALCSGVKSVVITVKGVPEGSKIYYNDSLVTVNPFRVDQGETLVPLRVESRGRRPFKISLTPSVDQVVNVKLGKVSKKPSEDKPVADSEVTAEKKSPPPKAKDEQPSADQKPEGEDESVPDQVKRDFKRIRWPWKRRKK